MVLLEFVAVVVRRCREAPASVMSGFHHDVRLAHRTTPARGFAWGRGRHGRTVTGHPLLLRDCNRSRVAGYSVDCGP